MAVVIESQKQVDLDKGIKTNVEVVDGKLQLEIVGEGTVVGNESVVPVMTSNTTPSPFVVSASTTYSNSFLPFYAFDRRPQTRWWCSVSDVSTWIKIYLGNERKILRYSLTSFSASRELDYMPRIWRIEGSNNDTDWTVIDYRENEPAWGALETREYKIKTPNFYRYYRLFIVDNYEHSNIKGVAEIKFFEEIPVYLYKHEGSYETPIIDLSIYSQEIKTISAIRNIPEGTDMKIYTSTSNDQITFSPYEEIDYSTGNINSPQGRYIKIKVELFGKTNEFENMVNEFSEDERDEFQDDEYLNFNERLSLKTEYIENMEEVESWDDEGGVYTKSIKILDFNNIKSIIYDYEGVTRSFIYHNGEYKKWDDGWQVVSTSFPTIQQFQDEGMDGLSVLDRVSSQFEQNMTDAGVLGEGMLFKTTIDLKRYIDINSLSRE